MSNQSIVTTLQDCLAKSRELSLPENRSEDFEITKGHSLQSVSDVLFYHKRRHHDRSDENDAEKVSLLNVKISAYVIWLSCSVKPTENQAHLRRLVVS